MTIFSKNSLPFKLTSSILAFVLAYLLVVGWYLLDEKRQVLVNQANKDLALASWIGRDGFEHYFAQKNADHLQSVALLGQALVENKIDQAWQWLTKANRASDLHLLYLSSDKQWSREDSVPFEISQQLKSLEQQLKNTKQDVAWGKLYFDGATQTWQLTSAYAIKDGQNRVGMAIFSVAVDQIIEQIREKITAMGLDLFVYDSNQQLIFHPDYGSRMLRDSVMSVGSTLKVRESIDQIIRGSHAINQSFKFQDWNKTIYGYKAHIVQSDWYLVYYVPERDVYKSLTSYTLNVVAVLFGLLLALMLLVVMLTRRLISLRLRQTNRVITRASTGQFDLQENVQGNDEIDQLNDHLNKLFGRVTHRLDVKQRELAIAHAKMEEFRALAQAVTYSDNAVLILELDYTINFADSKAEALLQQSKESLVGTRFFAFIYQHMSFITEQIINDIRRKQSWRGELVLTPIDSDEQIWVNTTITPMRSEQGQLQRFVVSLQDISFIKDSQTQIERLAYTDELTGVANRSFFKAQLATLVESVKRGHYQFTLVHLDIDNFKRVNDSLGYDGGDHVLKVVSERLNKALRREDVVARLGGDEFAIILGGMANEQAVMVAINNLQNQLQESIEWQGDKLGISVSIGMTMSQNDEDDPEVMLQHATMAMHQAKANGKNTFNFFTQALNHSIQHQLKIEQALQQAVNDSALLLYYQPKVDIAERKIVGYEALMRWIDPELGFIGPDDFIPIAEQSGLILTMSDWVMAEALRFYSKLEHKVPISINISARQFESGNCPQVLANLLEQYKIGPEAIELELTESHLMADIDSAIAQLIELKQLGVRLAIDDFGTGYSSFNYLKSLPVDTLKIDRSFVMDIPDDRNDMEITAAMVAIGQKLGLQVIAEGVENQQQVDFLRDNGCFILQGYFFSRPLPEHEALQWQPTF